MGSVYVDSTRRLGYLSMQFSHFSSGGAQSIHRLLCWDVNFPLSLFCYPLNEFVFICLEGEFFFYWI